MFNFDYVTTEDKKKNIIQDCQKFLIIDINY